MSIVAIIPAKASSKRVPEKNYRPFAADGRSLVDIAIDRLKAAGLPPDRIHLSCEDPDKEQVARAHGVRFLLRDPRLADNACHSADRNLYREVVAQVPGDDVLWYQVTSPLFNGIEDAIRVWPDARRSWDSLGVCRPARAHYLDAHFCPEGWQFGPWHVNSQDLPRRYVCDWTLFIFTREAVHRTGYPLGERPTWLPVGGFRIDIDTLPDFEFARKVYDAIHPSNSKRLGLAHGTGLHA